MSSMSMRAYARYRGVSVEAVSKAVKQKRISCRRDEKGQALINPEVADREWAANSDQSKVRENLKREPEAPPPEDEEPQKPGYAQFRAIRESYAARLSRLEFEEKTGKLVDGEEIRKLWVTLASIVRTKVLGIPSKVRQQIPEFKPADYEKLEAIVRETLEDIADG